MIQLAPQQSIFMQVHAIDFRKGIDALVGICRGKLKQNPFSGAVFAFRNKKGTAIKLLCFDGSGFWLMHKRFSRGTLRHWQKNQDERICTTVLLIILNQGQPGFIEKPWRPLDASNASRVL